MFPAFAKVNGIDQSKITWLSMDANLREQMLAKGEVDAITGFITSAVPSLNAIGVKTADINVMRYDAFGFDGFGNAVFASRDYVEKNTKAATVFGFGAAGRDAYRLYYLRFDFWFPVLSLSLFYVSLLSLAFPAASRFSWLNLTPILLWLSDAAENLNHFEMAGDYPNLATMSLAVGPIFTFVKWVLISAFCCWRWRALASESSVLKTLLVQERSRPGRPLSNDCTSGRPVDGPLLGNKFFNSICERGSHVENHLHHRKLDRARARDGAAIRRPRLECHCHDAAS